MGSAPPTPAPDEALCFGPFALSPARRELRHGTAIVPVGQRALDLLVLLAARAGDVVPRCEIDASLWPGQAGQDGRLRAHVAALRRALREGEDGSRYIVNVPRRGYVFVAAVRRIHAGGFGIASAGLPPRRHPLLGREQVTAALAAATCARRLVSIVGAGGLGKSALAVAVAGRSGARFADGVAYLDLAQVREDGSLADALPSLCASLAGRRLLLVLDNCCHLADQAALLAEAVLAACDGVHLLVTSREALALRTEWVHWLAPLAQPDQALDLFMRQFTAHGGAALDAAAMARAERLCRQLEGNPLALGLAAVQAGRIGLDALGAGIEALLAPMPAAHDDAGARHRSLDAMLDWSERRLAPRERKVLRRLAILRGGFTLDLAARVCADAALDAAQVKEAILVLGARSLLEAEEGRDPLRYRLSNTTRAYARRRLEHDGELPAQARRHLEAMLALYRGADADLQRLAPPQWRSRYAESDHDFAAAVEWALEQGNDIERGIELVALSWFVVLETGRLDVHRRRLALALGALTRLARPRPDLELQLLASMNMLHALVGGAPACAARTRARLDLLARGAHDPRQAVLALHALVAERAGQGDYPAVLRLAERILPQAARMGEPVALALAYRFRAQALHHLGLHGEACRTAAAVIESVAPQRNVHFLGPAPRALAMLGVQARSAWIGGRPDSALELAEHALALADGQHPFALCQALCMAALPVALWRGEAARARALCARLAGAVDDGATAHWRPWLMALHSWLEGQCPPLQQLPAPLSDLLATLDARLAGRASVRRVRQGLVGWSAPEVLRVRGERLRRASAPPAQVEAMWLAARRLARRQRALGWELRIATSLAGLWRSGAREREGLEELERLCTLFVEGADTADLARARACFTSFYMLEA